MSFLFSTSREIWRWTTPLLEHDIQSIGRKLESLATASPLQWYCVYGHSVCIQDAGRLQRRVVDGYFHFGPDDHSRGVAEADDLFARASVNAGGLGFPAKRAFRGPRLHEDFPRFLERLVVHRHHQHSGVVVGGADFDVGEPKVAASLEEARDTLGFGPVKPAPTVAIVQQGCSKVRQGK